jgi:RsiW-degrading membrane proteinase PrsW (M82 family)
VTPLVLYLLIGACALGAAVLVWRHDLHDREPWWALLGTAVLGALLMPACGMLEDRLIFAATGTPGDAWIAFVASLVEESARALLVLAVALLAPRLFNDPMDGITYGSMAGVGMSLWETSFYLGLDSALNSPYGALELARLGAHIVLGGLVGFPFGMWRTGVAGARVAFLLCAPTAAAMHFIVDWEGLRVLGDPAAGPGATVVVCLVVLTGAVAYGAATAQAAEWSRRRFAPCSAKTIFGWPFTLFVKPREIPDWCPPPEDGADDAPR